MAFDIAAFGGSAVASYAASKGGLLAFGRSLAAEGAGQGVLHLSCRTR